MLLVLGVLALGGVTALMFMAQRYSSILTRRAENEEMTSRRVTVEAPENRAPVQTLGSPDAIDLAEARRVVSEFVEIRRTMKTALRGSASQPHEAQGRLAESRRLALDASGLGAGEYEQVRVIYRRWRAGELDASTPFSRALTERQEELHAADLGAYESLDP
jgi:hypothetical protein